MNNRSSIDEKAGLKSRPATLPYAPSTFGQAARKALPSKAPGASLKGLRERNGNWHYRIKWQGRDVSGDTGLQAVNSNVLDAIAIRQRRVNELKVGAYVEQQERVEITVDQAVQKYLAWYRGEHPKRKTQQWAEAALSSFSFYFYGRVVSTVRAGDMENYKSWRRENKIVENSIRHNLTAANGFFKFGRKMRWLEHDPLEEVTRPSNKRASDMHVLSPEEEVNYHATALERSDVLADIFTIMIDQGCRPMEVMELAQRSIDLQKRRFTINDGKSENAKRTLKMTDRTYSIFQNRLAERGPWVFPADSETGHTVTLQKAHEWVAKQTGIDCVIYDFRHTFATRMAVAGCPLPILAKLLGHSDMNLLHIYVHPSQADMDRAMAAYAVPQNYDEMVIEGEDSDWQKGDGKRGPGPLLEENEGKIDRLGADSDELREAVA